MPNSITWAVKINKKKATLKTEFRTHDKFAKRLYYAFKPVWWLLHGWDWVTFKQPEWNLGFDTLTQYPGSTAANNPCDGTPKHVANTDYATLVGAAGNQNVTTEITSLLQAYSSTDVYSNLWRGIVCYDTSALTAGATISNVVMSLYGEVKSTGLGTPDYSIVSAAPASTSALANGDYDSLGGTAFSTKVNADCVTGAYVDWTLDGAGRGNVSKTGISQFGLRDSWDLAGEMGGTWVSNALTRFRAYSASRTGTSEDPKLVVTYTLGSGTAAFALLLGVG